MSLAGAQAGTACAVKKMKQVTALFQKRPGAAPEYYADQFYDLGWSVRGFFLSENRSARIGFWHTVIASE